MKIFKRGWEQVRYDIGDYLKGLLCITLLWIVLPFFVLFGLFPPEKATAHMTIPVIGYGLLLVGGLIGFLLKFFVPDLPHTHEDSITDEWNRMDSKIKELTKTVERLEKI